MHDHFTLLIVDDDADDQEMFTEVVNEINPSIVCIKAANGSEALQVLNEEQFVFDFIFLDLNMPRMNGRQCLDQIKRNEKTRHIPVVIYSTSKLLEDKEETDKLGAAHFITKPSSMAALKKELQCVFSQHLLDANQQ